MLASLLAAGMPLGAQNLGSEYRLKRVIPVEGRQGVAADSNFYYVSGSTALYKYDKQGRLAAKNERPFEGLPLAANHIGDIDVWDGEIYAGIETFDDGRGENIQVAVYDANTLKWKRSIDWEPSSGQVEVCGLAVDRDGDMVWMADWVDGRYVYGYNRKTGRYVRKVHLRPVPQWQQGIFMVAELLAGDLLHFFNIFHNLGENLVIDLAAILIILGAGLGGNGEALRHRQADVGHLSQIRALAAQQLAHIGVALGEQVTILLAHGFSPSFFASEGRISKYEAVGTSRDSGNGGPSVSNSHSIL